MVVANFGLRHRDQRLILQKICHFQPFLKFGVSKTFSYGPPFAEMPKMSDFSCLGNLRLRCVGTVVSGNKPTSPKGYVGNFGTTAEQKPANLYSIMFYKCLAIRTY